MATIPDVSTWRTFTTGSEYFLAASNAPHGTYLDTDISRWAHLYDDDCSPTAPVGEVGPDFFAELRARTGATPAPSPETAAADPDRSPDSTFVWLGVAGGAALVIVAAALVWMKRRAKDH